MTSTNENKSCNKYKVLLFNRILQTAFTLSSRYNRIMFNKYLFALQHHGNQVIL